MQNGRRPHGLGFVDDEMGDNPLMRYGMLLLTQYRPYTAEDTALLLQRLATDGGGGLTQVEAARLYVTTVLAAMDAIERVLNEVGRAIEDDTNVQ